MIYKTKYFGDVDCTDAGLFHFESGIPGFEDERLFLLLPFEESGGNMYSLQSAVTPALSFIVMDPFTLDSNYEPELSAADFRNLGVEHWQELSYCVLCALKNPISESTVNLRCPIAINFDTHQCVQIIMDTNKYDMRHPLSEFSRREDSSSC